MTNAFLSIHSSYPTSSIFKERQKGDVKSETKIFQTKNNLFHFQAPKLVDNEKNNQMVRADDEKHFPNRKRRITNDGNNRSISTAIAGAPSRALHEDDESSFLLPSISLSLATEYQLAVTAYLNRVFNWAAAKPV